MRRIPSRRPSTRSFPEISERSTILVVYDSIQPDEAAEIEKNVRACFPDWCPKHEWHHWTYEADKWTLSAAAEVDCDDPDQITTGLMYPAWQAIDHFSKVILYLDALVWEEPFHQGDEEDYRDYIEVTLLPAVEMEADDLARAGQVSEGRACLLEHVKVAEEQCRIGAPWSEELLKYYREALTAFDSRYASGPS